MTTKTLLDMTDPEIEELLRRVRSAMRDVLPRNSSGQEIGYAVLVCDAPGLMQVTTNVSRERAIAALRECADHLEAHRDWPRDNW